MFTMPSMYGPDARALVGVIDEMGNVVWGEGFDCFQTGPGNYQVHFHQPFNETPAVFAMLSQEINHPNFNSSVTALTDLGTTSIRIVGPDLEARDATFSLLVIGAQ